MLHSKLFFVIALILLFSSQAFAIVPDQQVKVLAVTSDGRGLGADLFLNLEAGNGTVWISAEPLVGTTTQSAAQVAVNLARNYSSDARKYDYKFSIQSNASLVEGPSAGAAMALVVISSLQNKKVPANVALTGTIDESGNVGQVGGIYEKSKEAANLGIDLFMIPRGEAVQTVRENGTVKSINLVQYGPTELGMKILEVGTIDEVLEYAFSDIDQIDISKIIEESEIPEFVPKNIEYKPHLQSMKDLVNNYLQESKTVIEQAKHAVSTTLINDPEQIATLLEIITTAEQLQKDAENLNAQNYLYSSANFAFLGRVNAIVVQEISNNPYLLSLNSEAFQSKLNQLSNEINDFEDSLEGNVPLDTLEWHISAQQRLSYAKLSLEKLSNTQTVVIGSGSDSAVALQKITEYAFAVAWLDVARDFEAITSQTNEFVKPDSEFKQLSDNLITQTENTLSSLPAGLDLSDIERRLNASKFENQKTWYAASAVDAATAKALIKSETTTQDLSLEELKELLQQKINALEAKIVDSQYEYSWPLLYVDHAKYFLEASNYYEENNASSRAIGSLRSGISLITLAEEITSSLEDIYDFYTSAQTTNSNGKPPTKIFFPILPQASNGNGQTNGLPSPYVIVFVILLFILGFAFLFFTLKAIAAPSSQVFSNKKELDSLKKMKLKADEALFAGKISKEKHSEIVKEYLIEMNGLHAINKNQSTEVAEIEQLRVDLFNLERKARELKKHFKNGVMMEEEFLSRKENLVEEIDSISSKLKNSMPSKEKILQAKTKKPRAKKAKSKNGKKKTSQIKQPTQELK